MSAWWAEGVTAKARVVAHYLESNLREAYRAEKTTEAAKQKEARGGDPAARSGEPPPPPDWAKVRQGGG